MITSWPAQPCAGDVTSSCGLPLSNEGMRDLRERMNLLTKSQRCVNQVQVELRLIRVFGHRHFWTTNFSAWIEREAGTTELIYQSYDWEDMPTYRYDSVVSNPPVDPESKVGGAVSGIVMLQPGDQLHFNCHIELTDERASQDSAAPLASELGNLRFANQAYNGEMCIQFGNVSGGRLGLPYVSSTAVPDFAKLTR